MRTWRVGTFSMGASLLLLGIFLLLSQWFGYNLNHILLSWWPIILIVLGGEILLFLFLSRQEKPFLKYDFLSIAFVGMIGTVGIVLATLNSTGILEKVNEGFQREERVMELPTLDFPIEKQVKRVVVNTERNPLTIEGTADSSVGIFGTYRANVGNGEKLITKQEDYVSMTVKGDTLYVSMKDVPRDSYGPFERYGNMAATLIVPSHLQLEVNGNGNEITLKPRTLLNNWTIDSASTLSLQVESESNMEVVATNPERVQGEESLWTITKEEKKAEDVDEYTEEYSEEPTIKLATMKIGEGQHQITLINCYEVHMQKINIATTKNGQ